MGGCSDSENICGYNRCKVDWSDNILWSHLLKSGHVTKTLLSAFLLSWREGKDWVMTLLAIFGWKL
jgi:hypothetical protein